MIRPLRSALESRLGTQQASIDRCQVAFGRDAKGGKVKPPYTTGFTLLFPPNDIRSPITFGVRRPDLSNQPIVPLST